MKTKLVVVVSFLPFIIGACGGQADVATERSAILQADKAWASAAAAKDVERTVSFWADDAMVFPPEQAVVSGKDAIRKFVAESFKLPGFAIRWETTRVTVARAGDLAYGAGTNEFTLNGADGKPITVAGKAVTVWRKEPDGTWKCVIDIWNNVAPPKPAAAL